MCQKFAIVKFDAISTYGTNPYKIVPFRWIKDTYGHVLVQYPSKDEVFIYFDRIFKCHSALPSWKEYGGTIEHLTDSYLDGLIFIKGRWNEFIPEEFLFIEYMERLCTESQSSSSSGKWGVSNRGLLENRTNLMALNFVILVPEKLLVILSTCERVAGGHGFQLQWRLKSQAFMEEYRGSYWPIGGHVIFKYAACLVAPIPHREVKKRIPVLRENCKEMADRRASSSRPEKSKDASGNAISRFIRRLSPTKRYHGDANPTPDPSSAQREASSSKKDTSPGETSSYQSYTPPKFTKMSLNLKTDSNTSSKSNLSKTSPWNTPSSSYQSLNRDENTTELKLLSQLHSTFDDATNILGKYIAVRNRKK